jgi:arsenite methyltransferase
MNHEAKFKVDYGFDGSPVAVFSVCLLGLACLGGGVAFFPQTRLPLQIFAVAGLVLGSFLVLVSAFYLYYVSRGKLQRRDAMLAQVACKGTETVLDVGTGRGLLMIGAAKRLGTGKSIGIDIWDSLDMHGNSRQNTLRNAQLEGVLEKVEVRNEDVRNLSFPDGTFDVVLSNLCLHNIPSPEERAKACREIARVLKPKGIAVIADKSFIRAYGDAFAAAGLAVEFTKISFDGSLRGLVKAVKT